VVLGCSGSIVELVLIQVLLGCTVYLKTPRACRAEPSAVTNPAQPVVHHHPSLTVSAWSRAVVFAVLFPQGLSVQVWRKYEDFIKELSGEAAHNSAGKNRRLGSSRVTPVSWSILRVFLLGGGAAVALASGMLLIPRPRRTSV
jgi:hypothetical protein